MTKSPVVNKGYRAGKKPGNAGQTYPPEALTPAEVRRLLIVNNRRKSTVSTRNHALIMVLYRTGMRINEALELRPTDIDFENATINIRRAKGGKHRVVGIDEAGLDAIQKWLNVRVAPMGSTLFCTRDGKKMYASYFRSVLKRLAEAAKVDKRVHPHMFRHTFAAELAREGVPPHVIQIQLGHSSLMTTTKYLRTIAPQEVIVAIRKRTWSEKEEEGQTDEDS